MRWQFAVAIGLACAGCAAQPQIYVQSLKANDPKWQSAACKAIRQQANDYEQGENERLKSSVMIGLLSPSGALATTDVTNKQNVRRKQFNRELHLRCSSAPLPEDLTNIPDIQPPPMLNTERGS
ncbi:hypothetical protein [Bosea caraganae]|nr:hypothetical protein [Bosea caraganae]